jgi:serine phosphatase RsbU (regulator of sigma subunit)
MGQLISDPILSRVPLFATLPASEIKHLQKALRRSEIPANSILFHEGERGDRFYIVLDGQVEIVQALGTADERLAGVRGPGEYFGEMSLLNRDALRTMSVRARTPVHLLEMARADFDGLLHRQPVLAYAMASVLSARLQESSDATIRDLQEKNRQLAQANEELKAAQAQIIEKEKLEHELQLAREIQESILPRSLPQLGGFDFGARMAPARSVGGDCFDFIALGGDSLGIVVGDVSGKGIPAAIFMALARSLLRAEGSRAASPREALQNVNRHLFGMNEAEMFVTVLYGVLNRGTREFQFVRAGHEMPIVVDGRGEAVTLPPGRGQPLGVIPEPALDEQRLIMLPGSTLLIYTDGVTDALNPQGAFFGLERLQEAVRANRQASAQALCDRLLQAVIEHQGVAPQHDDVTLVAVQAR